MPRRLTVRTSALLAVALFAVALFAEACAQSNDPGSDRELLAYIVGIKAIDVHAHPMRYVAAGAPRDTDYDALPLDGIPPFNVPYGVNPEHHHYREAQRALFGASVTDTGKVFLNAMSGARAETMAKEGEHYGEWVLNKTGIDIMLANRVSMGAGLPAARFKWVPFVDALMLPLDTRTEAARTPDRRALFPLEDKLRKRYLSDLGIVKIPATLDAYEKQVVTATLERQRAGGAVGVKFEAAYLRSLDFQSADAASARAIYARYANGGTPTHAEYTLLEDYLFRLIAREAGRIGLTVQIHSLEGFGGFYSAEGAAPHHLESTLNDSTLRATNFVVTHGGWPRVDETLALLGKANVYADISMMNVLADRASLVRTLRMWLAEYPDKVMFGTDAFDGGDLQGWEQGAWIAIRNTREALTSALTSMIRDGDISRDRAKQLARMVMRENAIRAYHLAQ